MSDVDNEDIEIHCLIEAIYQKYGYDFKGYSRNSLRRRVMAVLKDQNLENISQMLHKVIQDKVFFLLLLSRLTVNVTQMFRDPSFFRTLRRGVLPKFKAYPFLKIWIAGCSTGEEAYSVAITLKEEGLYERSQIYATDISIPVLERAKQGIYPAEMMRDYTRNYRNSGGRTAFSEYYTARYDHAIMDKELHRNITFADHNLATDSSFGVMDIIICRNVFIYFTKELQSQVLKLFHQSLNQGGILCLGARESILFLEEAADYFVKLCKDENIYTRTWCGKSTIICLSPIFIFFNRNRGR